MTLIPLVSLCFYNIFKMLLVSLLESTNIYGEFTNHYLKYCIFSWQKVQVLWNQIASVQIPAQKITSYEILTSYSQISNFLSKFSVPHFQFENFG